MAHPREGGERRRRGARQGEAPRLGTMRLAGFAVAVALLAGCEKQDSARESVDLGDKRAKLGAYREAVRAYESALDGTAKSAEVHYKLGVLYDDKLKTPLAAIHHYDRYLELVPTGGRSKEA